MILDRLENAARYVALHPRFAAAFGFLEQTDLRTLAVGRHEVDGERLYVDVSHPEGRGRAAAKLEAHRKYIDIQLSLAAPDLIGWKGIGACVKREMAYDAAQEAELFGDEPETWISLPPGVFVVFFPGDAHAPSSAEGPLHKVVVKVAVE